MQARLVSTSITVQEWWSSLQQSVKNNTAVTRMQERARRLMDAAGTVCNGLASLGPRNQSDPDCDNIMMSQVPANPSSLMPGSFPPIQPLRRNLADWNYLKKCRSDKQSGLKSKSPPSREAERGKTSQGRKEENEYSTDGRGALTIPKSPFSAQELECYLMLAIHSKDLNEQLETVPLEDVAKNKTVAAEACNKKKNRYRNNVPYDETRVVLHDNPDNDYINASYISCPSGRSRYIAAQGPKEANDRTVDDFWLMVWQNNTNMIIMVANLVEGGREKVALYWPRTVGGMEEYGNVKVMLRFEEERLDYTFRHLIVSVDACSRHVVQYQYTGWPDHGVPPSPVGAARMIYNISTWEWSGPPVIHCSAGLGRTGTILLVMALLNTLKTEGHFDPPHALHKLRMCRANMLDNQLQYRFAHQVLLMILFGTRTSLAMDRLLGKDDTSIKQEFQNLKSFPMSLSFNWASVHNSTLNRDKSVLPVDGRQAMLMVPVSQHDGQYVNAVQVRGSNLQDAYIVTEHPMSHTMGRAWKLAFTRYASAWVFLHDHTNLLDRKKFPSVLLSKGHEMGDLTLHVGSQVEKHFFNETTVTVSQITSHTMQVIQFKDWHPSREIPGHTQSLFDLVERLWEIQREASYSPIIISCNDGYSASGVLVTLARLMEEVKLTQRVDFFHTVLSVRCDRPQFIKSERQYSFLHSAVIAYHKRITEARKGQIPADGKEIKRQVRRDNGDQNTVGERSNVVNKGLMVQTRSPNHKEMEIHYSNRQRKVRSHYISKDRPEVKDILHDTGKDRDQERRKQATLPYFPTRQESKEVDTGNKREGHTFIETKQSKTKRDKIYVEDSPYEYLWQWND